MEQFRGYQKEGNLNAQAAVLLLAGTVVILMASLMYYVFSFTDQYDMSWWLNTGYDRMIIPGAVLLWLGAWLVLSTAATAKAG